MPGDLEFIWFIQSSPLLFKANFNLFYHRTYSNYFRLNKVRLFFIFIGENVKIFHFPDMIVFSPVDKVWFKILKCYCPTSVPEVLPLKSVDAGCWVWAHCYRNPNPSEFYVVFFELCISFRKYGLGFHRKTPPHGVPRLLPLKDPYPTCW